MTTKRKHDPHKWQRRLGVRMRLSRSRLTAHDVLSLLVDEAGPCGRCEPCRRGEPCEFGFKTPDLPPQPRSGNVERSAEEDVARTYLAREIRDHEIPAERALRAQTQKRVTQQDVLYAVACRRWPKEETQDFFKTVARMKMFLKHADNPVLDEMERRAADPSWEEVDDGQDPDKEYKFLKNHAVFQPPKRRK